VVSAPRINARISESGIIEGGFTQEQTQDLAIMLRSGALPGRLTIVEEKIEAPGGS
jgi:preprotein translocase subunit SecD